MRSRAGLFALGAVRDDHGLRSPRAAGARQASPRTRRTSCSRSSGTRAASTPRCPNDRLTASPSGVVPVSEGAIAPDRGGVPPERRWIAAAACVAEPACPSPGPSRRSSSAWLRSNPTTSTISSTNSTVSTDTRCGHRAAASRTLNREALQTVGLVRAGPVVDHQRVVTAQLARSRVLADHQPADDLGDAAHLRVALPVAEVVAVDAAVPAVALGALAPAGEDMARDPVAVEVVADPLVVAQPPAAVVGALPPAGDVGAGRAAVVAMLELAAERGVPVRAQARPAVARPDDRPGRARAQQVAQRGDRKRRAGDRRPGDRATPRDPALERRARPRSRSAR